MATTDINDLTKPIGVEEFKTSIYETLEDLGVTTTNWKPGSVVRSIIYIVAIMLAALSLLVSEIAKSGFLDTATGSWLTLVAKYVYGVARIESTFAVGSVQLSNSSGGNYILSVGDLIVKSSTTGKTYTNTAAVTVGPLATNVSVAIQAIEAGSDSTAFAGEIDTMVTTFSGVTVTNAAVVVGYDDEEDEPLRVRCRAKLGALSPNGPSDAYYYFATSAVRLDGTPIGVTRVSKPQPDGYGNLKIWVANSSGTLPGTIGDTSTDLGKVDDDIQTKCVPLSVSAIVDAAVATPLSVTYEIWMYNTSGLSEDEIKDAIQAELSEFISSRPIGGDIDDLPPGKVFKSAIAAVIGRAKTPTGVPLGIFKVDVTIPASDAYTLTVEAAPVLGSVTCTEIHQLTI